MNPNDKKQLQDLMSMSEAGYEYWLQVASEDQIDKALELMNLAREEINTHLRSVTVQLDEEDLTEASTLLKNFTLTGKK